MIVQYCERQTAGLLAEPINLVSNVAYVIAAWMFYRSQKRHASLEPEQVAAFCALLVLVALCSAAFHSIANKLTEVLDSLAILTFVSVYLWLSLRLRYATTLATTVVVLCSFHVANVLIALLTPHSWLNGSLFYLPTWIVLLFMAASAPAPRLRRRYFFALGLFSGCVLIRGIDLSLCPQLPIGTHFLWHIGTATLLFYLLKGLDAGGAVQTIAPHRID